MKQQAIEAMARAIFDKDPLAPRIGFDELRDKYNNFYLGMAEAAYKVLMNELALDNKMIIDAKGPAVVTHRFSNGDEG